MKDMIEIAEEIARESHKGQKRWDGKEYITHVEAVVDSFKGIPNAREFQIVAWLHDVLEDSDLTYEDLLSKEVPEFYATSVKAITRRKDQDYIDYILQVKEDGIAIEVKIADLKHNLFNLKKGSMKDKYLLALHILGRSYLSQKENPK